MSHGCMPAEIKYIPENLNKIARVCKLDRMPRLKWNENHYHR